MAWLLTLTGSPCMASNVKYLCHSIVYISVIYVRQGGAFSPGICHLNLNLSLEMYASVTIVHVQVLVFTAAVNNSYVALCTWVLLM